MLNRPCQFQVTFKSQSIPEKVNKQEGQPKKAFSSVISYHALLGLNSLNELAFYQIFYVAPRDHDILWDF